MERWLCVLVAVAACASGCAASEVHCLDCAAGDGGGDGKTDEGPPRGPYDPQLFGPLIVDANGADLLIEVPAQLASFTLTLSAPQPATARLGFHELAAPDGTVLYTLGATDNLNPAVAPYPGAAAIMLPTGDDTHARPVTGTYRARVGLFETTDGATFTAVDGDIGIATATLVPMSAIGGVLDLRILSTPGSGVTGGDAFLDGALAEVQHYYQDVAGVPLGQIAYGTLPDTFDTIVGGDAVRAACAAHADLGPNGTEVNVFIVSSIDFAAGLAGGAPGPPGTDHTAASCVVIAKQSTALATGALMAHEVGHFLGLFHSTFLVFDEVANQYTLQGHDALSDTPECGHGTPVQDCPDFDNLMFPFFPVTGLSLSPAQIDIIKRSPWLTR